MVAAALGPIWCEPEWSGAINLNGEINRQNSPELPGVCQTALKVVKESKKDFLVMKLKSNADLSAKDVSEKQALFIAWLIPC